MNRHNLAGLSFGFRPIQNRLTEPSALVRPIANSDATGVFQTNPAHGHRRKGSDVAIPIEKQARMG